MTEQEAAKWRAQIVTDAIQAQRALDALEREDHDKFVVLCRRLANDPDERVKRIALRKLGQRGDRDDLSAEASALAVLGRPSLRDVGLFALGRVGTSRAFPLLLEYAREGSSRALASASDQVRTETDTEQLLSLARQHLMAPGSKGFRLREESLRILLRYSTAEAEQDTLLSAARLYADDFVVESLAAASTGIIAELLEIRSAYSQNSLEYVALSNTIERLQRRREVASESPR